MSKNKHLGTSFDDFLQAEGLLGELEALATKRVLKEHYGCQFVTSCFLLVF